MKRSVLITTGTLGGLGAVLAITPPKFSEVTIAANEIPQSPIATTSPSPETTAKPVKTKTPKPIVTPSKTPNSSPTPASTPTSATTPAQSATPVPTISKPTGASGTFTGGTYDANRYGRVSVTVTLKNGEITNVAGTQSPTSWSQNVIPTLDSWLPQGKITISQIVSISADSLPCAVGNSCRSRASYTATAYWSSVKSALNKAGY